MDNEAKYQFSIEQFKNFKNHFEIHDFRKFLLLILNLDAGGPEAMLQQLGMGSKKRVVLPYNPEAGIYYTKVMSGLSYHNQLLIYHKTEKLSETFVNDAESTLFTESLSAYERENFLPGKFKILTPEVKDFTAKILIGKNSNKPLITGIESLYFNLAEMIVSQQSKYLFLIEGDVADVLFSMNISFAPSHDGDNIQMLDIFVDEEKKYRDFTFIRMKEGELEMALLKEIQDMSHGELYKSHFTIIVPIKSFDTP